MRVDLDTYDLDDEIPSFPSFIWHQTLTKHTTQYRNHFAQPQTDVTLRGAVRKNYAGYTETRAERDHLAEEEVQK